MKQAKLRKIMPEKISRDVKHEALSLIQQGQKQVDVAATLGISDRTIRRARSKARKHGDIEGGQKKAGPKPKLTPEMENVIPFFILIADYIQLLVRMVFYDPAAYLHEYVSEFDKRYPGMGLTVSHLSKILIAKDLNRKKVLFLYAILICSFLWRQGNMTQS